MNKIIKKLNKNNIKFNLGDNNINFNINDTPYIIKKINNNKYLINAYVDTNIVTYKKLINLLNKYNILKKW